MTRGRRGYHAYITPPRPPLPILGGPNPSPHFPLQVPTETAVVPAKKTAVVPAKTAANDDDLKAGAPPGETRGRWASIPKMLLGRWAIRIHNCPKYGPKTYPGRPRDGPKIKTRPLGIAQTCAFFSARTLEEHFWIILRNIHARRRKMHGEWTSERWRCPRCSQYGSKTAPEAPRRPQEGPSCQNVNRTSEARDNSPQSSAPSLPLHGLAIPSIPNLQSSVKPQTLEGPLPDEGGGDTHGRSTT